MKLINIFNEIKLKSENDILTMITPTFKNDKCVIVLKYGEKKNIIITTSCNDKMFELIKSAAADTNTKLTTKT